MLKKSLAAFAILVGFTSPAGAATCIPEASLKEQGPFASTYVHSISRNDGTVVSLYLKDFGTEQNGFKETLLEVVRKDQCILATNTLSRTQVDDQYQIYASWTELEDGAAGDNEGMPVEEDAEVALSAEDEAPVQVTANNADKLAEYYELYIYLRACNGRSTQYLSTDNMERARDAISMIETRIVESDRSADKEALWKVAQKKAERDPLLTDKAGDANEIGQACSEMYSMLMSAPGVQQKYLEKDF